LVPICWLAASKITQCMMITYTVIKPRLSVFGICGIY